MTPPRARHPYAGLPARQVWRRAVRRQGSAPHEDGGLKGLWRPAFPLAHGMRVIGLGSCFARHMAPWLRAAGLDLPDHEPPPPGMDRATALRFGHLAYPCRTGNIYTVRQMLQLVQDARTGAVHPADVWWRGGRAHDALRPGVEPGGLDNADEVLALRRAHLARVHEMFVQAEVLVFTLGMAEAWACAARGRVYPLAPGILAGEMDPDRFRLEMFCHAAIRDDLRALRRTLREINPQLRMVLTVSPVPLAATATGDHALVSNTAAKAALRSAAGEMAARHTDVDYFPAWEIVMHPGRGQPPFGPDLRDVRAEVVAQVMRCFLTAQGLTAVTPSLSEDDQAGPHDGNPFCEERLADAFLP
ncbi:MAG: GSCFA domain-containing protein [Rhodobacteraceae bacterium]|nr:GSCFA domain-containing protein [Paracoccaceae bacterium]